MREIKFRAVVIDDDGKERLEYNVWPTGPSPGMRHLRGLVDNGGFWMDCKRFEQYTGLKDKNGKEIYEGDIINCAGEYDEIRYRLGVVKFGQGVYDSGFYRFQGFYVERQGLYKNDSWGWEITDEDGTANILMKDKPFCEVIGNIYENPEHL